MEWKGGGGVRKILSKLSDKRRGGGGGKVAGGGGWGNIEKVLLERPSPVPCTVKPVWLVSK